jgi:AcrR family transcriptional regulator
MNQFMATERQPRADAVRNRKRLLEVAKQAFTELGADLSLEDVARRAGVGAGTLYRHFPNRNALLEGVYLAEVEKLADEGPRLTESLPPPDALKAWMLLFIDYVATKKIIVPALNSLMGDPSTLFESSGAQIKNAIRSLVDRAIESGDIRADVEPLDLLRALVGVANVGAAPDWQPSAKRLVDILLLGSRPLV